MKTIIYQCLPDAIPPQNCIILKDLVAIPEPVLALLIVIIMLASLGIYLLITNK